MVFFLNFDTFTYIFQLGQKYKKQKKINLKRKCFQHFGEITKNDIDKTTPYLKLTYATRLNAEQAMLRGRRFNEKQLQVS